MKACKRIRMVSLVANESPEELFAMERTANRFPNGGDTDEGEIEETSEQAGLARS